MIVAVLASPARAEYLRIDLSHGDFEQGQLAVLVADHICCESLGDDWTSLVRVVDSPPGEPGGAVDRLVERAERAFPRTGFSRLGGTVSKLEWRIRHVGRVARLIEHGRLQRARRRLPNRLAAALASTVQEEPVAEIWLYDAWVADLVTEAVSSRSRVVLR